jgi:diguanylate cyclase (GGDEF)-like protein
MARAATDDGSDPRTVSTDHIRLGNREPMSLDTSTLLTLSVGAAGLMGLMLLIVWWQERSTRALAWWGAAYLTGAAAAASWNIQDALTVAEWPNALLFAACGAVWNGTRLFHGRRILLGSLFAGATVWAAATQLGAVGTSGPSRAVLSSLIIASYAFLSALELRRDRRKPRGTRWLSIGVPLLHGLVFLSPIVLVGMASPDAPADGWLALVALETMLYAVGAAFLVVVMAKERIALVHKTAAMTDPLTGLYNRRAFHEAAQLMMAQQARKRMAVSVLAFDLDKFKSINDRFGHGVGDDALKVFAAAAMRSMRATDVLGRLGGEEFAAIVPGTASEAAIVGERVRAAFESAGVEISSHRIGATVSIGIASAVPPTAIEVLLERADVALYRAKESGRNRVELATVEVTAIAAAAPGEAKSGKAAAPEMLLAG